MFSDLIYNSIVVIAVSLVVSVTALYSIYNNNNNNNNNNIKQCFDIAYLSLFAVIHVNAA